MFQTPFQLLWRKYLAEKIKVFHSLPIKRSHIKKHTCIGHWQARECFNYNLLKAEQHQQNNCYAKKRTKYKIVLCWEIGLSAQEPSVHVAGIFGGLYFEGRFFGEMLVRERAPGRNLTSDFRQSKTFHFRFPHFSLFIFGFRAPSPSWHPNLDKISRSFALFFDFHDFT